MWQSIYADLKDQNFAVIAIAMDSADAARPWIEAAKPTYPCLIDRDHHVADLYNMVNVPQATWIDEQGRIVRPPENAGSSDAFRHMDRVTKQMTADQLAEFGTVVYFQNSMTPAQRELAYLTASVTNECHY